MYDVDCFLSLPCKTFRFGYEIKLKAQLVFWSDCLNFAVTLQVQLSEEFKISSMLLIVWLLSMQVSTSFWFHRLE